MTIEGEASIHASAVLAGRCAVLIRGPSGSGKSRLAFDLILAGRAGVIAPVTLIGDDRVHVLARDGVLMIRPAPALAGLIEIRGLGIRRCDFAAEGIAGLVVDLQAPDAERLPPPEALQTCIDGILIPRIPVQCGFSGLPLVIAALTMTANSSSAHPSADCSKEFGNHITPTLATE
ncbi:MAG TPA: HPr kinase/phosphatase C-terminal domain-containing protein [Bradyrhizobium sp.]|uniref:HPr kinase/phosphorylase n=1 Tax=Bradyrhizobium sp. TaxID=376 RepID=UPI002D80BD30|nr:HPr kinase/phosphatase C-terminal domain-containing protein [Bradyrhizobium sp.]HET7888393.1 HPr kinase/phosphatase C-terminal domain-containing protein [Bradyrhizobium sp.]